jgi:hypothetical protein
MLRIIAGIATWTWYLITLRMTSNAKLIGIIGNCWWIHCSLFHFVEREQVLLQCVSFYSSICHKKVSCHQKNRCVLEYIIKLRCCLRVFLATWQTVQTIKKYVPPVTASKCHWLGFSSCSFNFIYSCIINENWAQSM